MGALLDVLLPVAPTAPVFIGDACGIGKSALIEQFLTFQMKNWHEKTRRSYKNAFRNELGKKLTTLYSHMRMIH